MTSPAKKPKRARHGASTPTAMFQNVEADFQCRWQDCQDIVQDLSGYYMHLKRHIWNQSGTRNETGETCQWRDCHSDAPWTPTHVYYHGYHEKLKVMGDKKLQARPQDGFQCSYANDKRHTVEIFQPFECKWLNCDYVLEGPDEFNFHILVHANDLIEGVANHRTKKFKCLWENCGQEYSYSQLRQHGKSHSSQKDAACSQCGSIFRSANKFLDHFRRQVPTATHECRYCAKKFSNERLLRDHERGHISHYKCLLCEMTMPSSSDVRNHIAVRHTTERRFGCVQCPSRFKLARNLSTHIERVHNSKDLPCVDCDFVTRSQYKLRKHRLIEHDGGTRVYACHLCPAKFDIEGHLLSRHLVSDHGLQWPSGHCRFHYVRDRDGVFRLQTFRCESATLKELGPKEFGMKCDDAQNDDDEALDEEEDDDDGEEEPEYVEVPASIRNDSDQNTVSTLSIGDNQIASETSGSVLSSNL